MATQQQVDKNQVFDQSTKEKIQAYLEEIENKQSQRASGASNGKYIKFIQDKERKLLSFTGKFEKLEVPDKDFETGQENGKYITRYFFDCYDITDPNNRSPELSVWERGTRDARTILYYLSKKRTVLEVIRNGQPRSKTTTYMIMPPVE